MWPHCRMHGIVVTNGAIVHHEGDDVDLLYHCNAYVFLLSVYGLLGFKEHPWVIASKYSICDSENNSEFKVCSMFKLRHNRNGMIFHHNWI